MPVIAALWFSFLFLPFKGIRASALLFVVLAVAIPAMKFISKTTGKIKLPAKNLSPYVPQDKRYLYLFLVPLALVPFFAQDYIIDVVPQPGMILNYFLSISVK